MPRFAISDYIFYKFACLDSSVELCYVGSTANWKQRKQRHKSDCNNENGKSYNLKVYTLIRANGGWDNFKMIEIGKQEQITLRQAEFIEEQYRVELNADMNGRRCFTTEEERKEQLKKWRENNKEHMKAYAQTETNKAKQALANKKYHESEHGKANRQTPEAKASRAARSKKYRESEHGKANKAFLDKKYYDKKKAEKTETAL